MTESFAYPHQPAGDLTSVLIVNADDWGGWPEATDAALECHRRGRITSVTAMVFMSDSERAAKIADGEGIDVGLHLNFHQLFDAGNCPSQTARYQQKTSRFLKSSKYAQLIYNPLLRSAFRHLFEAQLAEFQRLYGRPPSHFDGHRHMHLCTNVLWDTLIPSGAKVRRSYSFWPGEKDPLNRSYRGLVNRRLQKHYIITDHFFSLGQCLQKNRLERVLHLARTDRVELMTHPEYQHERDYLLGEQHQEALAGLETSTYAALDAGTLRSPSVS